MFQSCDRVIEPYRDGETGAGEVLVRLLLPLVVLLLMLMEGVVMVVQVSEDDWPRYE